MRISWVGEGGCHCDTVIGCLYSIDDDDAVCDLVLHEIWQYLCECWHSFDPLWYQQQQQSALHDAFNALRVPLHCKKTGLQSWSKIVDVSHWVPRTIPGHQADDKECLMIKMSWYDQLMTVGCHSMIWLLTTDACTQKLSFSALIQLVGSFDV